MARPNKDGLDYFPLDIDMPQDDKVYLLEAKHGLIGFAVFVRLLMRVYKNGYYCIWTEREELIFSKQISVEPDEISHIVDSCIEFGLFDKDRFERYKILTSKSIQERYIDAVKRRKRVIIYSKYCMVSTDDYINLVIVDINPDNDNINGVNATSCAQSKVKESKVNRKKSKVYIYTARSDEEERKENSIMSLLTNTGDECWVSKIYFKELVELYPAVDVGAELRKIKAWLISNPSKRKTATGMTRFINSWLSRAQDNAPGAKSKAEEPRYDWGSREVPAFMKGGSDDDVR